MRDDASPNHEFAMSSAVALAGGAAPRILDFGCGTGTLVARGRQAGHAFFGADPFATKYKSWEAKVPPLARPHIDRIVDGRLPYADASFDVVTANMVFEHIAWPMLDGAMREIARVLKPGAPLLAFFPMSDVWFEGHLGLYFPHRLTRWPRLLRAYLLASHGVGLGYHRRDTAADWADRQIELLATNIFHHDWRAFRDLCIEVMGAQPASIAPDFMRFRLAHRGYPESLARSRLLDAPLGFACHRLAAHFMVVRKRA